MTRLSTIFLILAGLSSWVWPQSGQPYIRNFEAREYSGHTQNWAITQDKTGLIYVANGKGVLEFDGSSWRLITIPSRSAVRSVAADSSGRVYVGAKNDFGYLAPNSFGLLEFHSLRHLLASEADDFGDVWEAIITGEGIYFRSPQQLFRYDPKNNQVRSWAPVTRFSLSGKIGDQFCIIQRDVGLTKMVNDTLVTISDHDVFKNKSVYSLLPLSNGTVLVGTSTSGLYLFDGDLVKFPAQVDSLLEKYWFSHACQLSDGSLALATRYRGFYVIDSDGKLLRHIDEGTGLHDNSVWYTFIDSQGGLWAALNNGLARIEIPSSLSYFGKQLGLNGKVLDIQRFQERLYLATSPAGVYYLERGGDQDGSRPRRVSGIETQCWSLLPYKNRLLVAANSGLFSVQGIRAELLLPAERDRFEPSTLAQARLDDNLILAGLYNGLAVVKNSNGKWSMVGRVPGVSGEIRTMVQFENGTVWLGSRASGIYRLVPAKDSFLPREKAYLNGKVDHFGQDDLPSGQNLVFKVDRRIVVASESDGLFAFDRQNNRFVPDTTFGNAYATGAIDVEVIEQDGDGNLWFGSEESGQVDFFKRENGRYFHMTSPTERIPASPIMTIYAEQDGQVWFSTIDGLVRYEGRETKSLNIPFRTMIRQVRINRDSVIFAGNAGALQVPGDNLPFSMNSIDFTFSATSYVAGSSTLFRSRLVGFDNRWSQWSSDRQRSYTNLPPGSYRFSVQSRNVYGLPGQEAAFDFSIKPPFYRTWFAYAAYVVLLAGLLLAIRRYELRRNFIRMETRRKSAEIEEARKLQMSLLPASVPETDQAEIAVFIKTATEVGGDYYDFYRHDNSLSVVIGDATGHGLNAGMMVTAAKSVLVSLRGLPTPKQVLINANKALKQLGFGRLYMALQMVRIENRKAMIASAGMPALLWHRLQENTVSEIALKAMPLGAFSAYPYEQVEIALSPGDTLLLMSDGFPERLDAQGDMLGYDEAKNVLQQIAHESVEEIIDHFVRYSDQWADDEPLNDDMTFIAIRIK